MPCVRVPLEIIEEQRRVERGHRIVGRSNLIAHARIVPGPVSKMLAAYSTPSTSSRPRNDTMSSTSAPAELVGGFVRIVARWHGARRRGDHRLRSGGRVDRRSGSTAGRSPHRPARSRLSDAVVDPDVATGLDGHPDLGRALDRSGRRPRPARAGPPCRRHPGPPISWRGAGWDAHRSRRLGRGVHSTQRGLGRHRRHAGGVGQVPPAPGRRRRRHVSR